jgi:hypothetical protein
MLSNRDQPRAPSGFTTSEFEVPEASWDCGPNVRSCVSTISCTRYEQGTQSSATLASCCPHSASSHAPVVFRIFKAPLFPDGYEQEGAHCLRVTLASDATPPLQADISCSFDAFPSEPSLGEKHIAILVRLLGPVRPPARDFVPKRVAFNAGVLCNTSKACPHPRLTWRESASLGWPSQVRAYVRHVMLRTPDVNSQRYTQASTADSDYQALRITAGTPCTKVWGLFFQSTSVQASCVCAAKLGFSCPSTWSIALMLK